MAARHCVSLVRRPAALAALLLAALTLYGPLAAAQPVINVILDRALVVHVDRPADTVIIGNPLIADATVRDNQTLIITGRSFGTTNLIVLDKDGREIANHLLTVAVADDNLVTVFNRAGRQTYSCTPVCEPLISIGDDKTTFSERAGQIGDRNSLIPDSGNTP